MFEFQIFLLFSNILHICYSAYVERSVQNHEKGRKNQSREGHNLRTVFISGIDEFCVDSGAPRTVIPSISKGIPVLHQPGQRGIRVSGQRHILLHRGISPKYGKSDFLQQHRGQAALLRGAYQLADGGRRAGAEHLLGLQHHYRLHLYF